MQSTSNFLTLEFSLLLTEVEEDKESSNINKGVGGGIGGAGKKRVRFLMELWILDC